MKKILFLFCLGIAATSFAQDDVVVTEVKKGDFELNVVHINDHHSHIEEETMDLTIDGAKTKVTIGGMPRIATKINEIRRTEKNPLVLHAGDAITGTLYYTLFNGEADAKMINAVKFDLFTLGNHEFDGGNQTLKKMLDVLEVPVVSSNVLPDKGSILANKWTPYKVFDIDGEKVGVIGLDIVGKTKNSSSPGKDIKFTDEVTTTQKYVNELTNQGINKIILLSHYGYDNNVDLAAKVNGVDIIVSGDTHYLLGRNFDKYGLTSMGDYPTRVTSKAGEPVYVVEAWNYSYVLGHLKAVFDNKGVIKSVEGKPKILIGENFFERRDDKGNKYQVAGEAKEKLISAINKSVDLEIVKNDPKVDALLDDYKVLKQELAKEVIGTVKDEIPGGSENRIPNAKNPSGSYATQLVADSMLLQLKTMGTGDVDFVIQNSGGVRITLTPGDFTYETGYTLLPFSNTIYTLKASGKEIKDVLEEAINFSLDPNGSSGSFPYGAGIRFEANKEGTLGTRVTKIEVQDRKTGKWETIKNDKIYVVGTNAYIAEGKDGYVTFGKAVEKRGGTNTYIDDAKSFIEYVKTKKVLEKPKETNSKFKF